MSECLCGWNPVETPNSSYKCEICDNEHVFTCKLSLYKDYEEYKDAYWTDNYRCTYCLTKTKPYEYIDKVQQEFKRLNHEISVYQAALKKNEEALRRLRNKLKRRSRIIVEKKQINRGNLTVNRENPTINRGKEPRD